MRKTQESEDERWSRLDKRNDGFSRAPEIDFRYETKAKKVMVDFKFEV